MTNNLGRVARIALLCLSAGGCAPLIAANSTPPAAVAAAEWPGALGDATREVLAGRYAAADRLLADFAVRFPSTVEGMDALYYRALFKLDPANTGTAPHDGATVLDSYLAESSGAPHHTDAVVLRRLVTALEAKPATVTVTSPAAAPVSTHSAEDKARDEELVKTRDELAKVNAELERIKKRLAAPKP